MIKIFIKKVVRYFTVNNFVTLNRIEISKSAFLHNFSIFQKNNSNFGIMPVLKSNAYGHGIVQCAQILNSASCDLLAVDGYYEAAKILEVTKHRLLVMGYIKPGNYKLLNTKKCSFVIQDIDGLIAFGELNKKVNIHLELNTGMNRLGLSTSELDDYLEVLKKYPKIKLEGVMTHLADADNDDDSFTKNQVKRFDLLVERIVGFGFSPNYIHVAQTAGSLIARSKYANSIRIGIGMYGLNPLNQTNRRFDQFAELRPVMELKSTIIKTINLKSGEKVSYNGIFTARKDMKIGVLPLGYYEGLPRELSNCGFVYSRNKKLPIIGRVCMNHAMIDLDDTNLDVGDEITIISNNANYANSIAGICKIGKLFNYQVISGITDNIRRVIVG